MLKIYIIKLEVTHMLKICRVVKVGDVDAGSGRGMTSFSCCKNHHDFDDDLDNYDYD